VPTRQRKKPVRDESKDTEDGDEDEKETEGEGGKKKKGVNKKKVLKGWEEVPKHKPHIYGVSEAQQKVYYTREYISARY